MESRISASEFSDFVMIAIAVDGRATRQGLAYKSTAIFNPLATTPIDVVYIIVSAFSHSF